MNLKEAFRYQNFIKQTFDEARVNIVNPGHAFVVTKNHKRHDANPAADDVVETPEAPDYYDNDSVIRFAAILLSEKENVCKAIAIAKAKVMEETGFSIDQAAECNKMRRDLAASMNRMLTYKAKKRTERGSAYMLNNEGNQTPYYYDIEVDCKEAYDRASAKGLAKEIIADADEASMMMDQVLVNTEVDFAPMFSVNDTFDDVMEKYFNNVNEAE